MLLKNQWVNDEIKEEIKNTLRQMTMKTQPYISMGCSKSSPKREVHSDMGLPQKARKNSNKQPNQPPKTTRKRKRNKT